MPHAQICVKLLQGDQHWEWGTHLVLRRTLRIMIFCSRSYMWPDATVNTCTRSSSCFATSPGHRTAARPGSSQQRLGTGRPGPRRHALAACASCAGDALEDAAGPSTQTEPPPPPTPRPGPQHPREILNAAHPACRRQTACPTPTCRARGPARPRPPCRRACARAAERAALRNSVAQAMSPHVSTCHGAQAEKPFREMPVKPCDRVLCAPQVSSKTGLQCTQDC